MGLFGDIGDYLINLNRIDYVCKRAKGPRGPSVHFAHSPPLELTDAEMALLVRLLGAGGAILAAPGHTFSAAVIYEDQADDRAAAD